MNEHDPPPLPRATNDPYQAPASNTPPPADGGNEGSVGTGIAISIALLVLGTPLTFFFLAMLGGLLTSIGVNLYVLWLPLGLLPLIAVIATGIWFTRRGLRKTAKGIWLGFAITIGLVLLLFAACFGLLAGSNFH